MNPLFDKKIVKRLRGLADGSITPEYPYYGVCAEIGELVEFKPGRLSPLVPYFRTWTHFSGDSVYPVHDSEIDGSAKRQYNRTSDLWHGRSGELRRDLCSHIANEIEKEL